MSRILSAIILFVAIAYAGEVISVAIIKAAGKDCSKDDYLFIKCIPHSEDSHEA